MFLSHQQVFSDDEELARDTTAVGLASGRDIQGIPWHLTQYTRESYRVRGWYCLYVLQLLPNPVCKWDSAALHNDEVSHSRRSCTLPHAAP